MFRRVNGRVVSGSLKLRFSDLYASGDLDPFNDTEIDISHRTLTKVLERTHDYVRLYRLSISNSPSGLASKRTKYVYYRGRRNEDREWQLL
jgi:hypothetical protein